MKTENLKAKYANIIKKPRITEKATLVSQSNVYVFEVDSRATKDQVIKTIRAFYKVSPIKVNMVKNPAKKVFVRGKKGLKSGLKKAYVYLKKGDKIE